MFCHFCKKNIKEIDFHNTELIEKFVSKSSKIKGKKKTGLCAKHQRELAQAVKRARILALMPFVSK
ncbi:MAG: 30S ribosomal protein S18 [Candidatus Pacebacteria bacterium]|nr:30S ribosomal protein S18 [Candidatus Paceibacterota bacterium]